MSRRPVVDPEPDVAGWAVGHLDRLAAVPPEPRDRIAAESVEEYLRSRHLDVDDFAAWRAGS